jgi:CRISPR-associated endonuclease Cas3-HD
MNDKPGGSTPGRARYLAHSANDEGRGVVEPLAVHLQRVTERARSYAGVFGADAEARLTGMLHDIGKYSPRFLDRLAGKESGLDHWTPGAILARKHYGTKGTAIAVAVLGHHLGLQHAGPALKDELLAAHRNPADNLTEANTALLFGRLADDGLRLPASLDSSVYDSRQPTIAAMLDVRMLFSALVDADFVETEAHFNGDAETPRRYRPVLDLPLQPERAIEIVHDRVAELGVTTKASESVKAIRRELFRSCLEGAANPPGLFTLSAPTGAGKTLAMLAFALEHARRCDLRRVVVVIPYLSIIEQTARVYRPGVGCARIFLTFVRSVLC